MSALERKMDAQEREIALIERAAEAERRRRQVDKNGFATDANGNTITAQGIDANYVVQLFKGQGLTDEQAHRAARELVDSNGNVHLNGYSSIFEAVVAIAKKYKGGSSFTGGIDTSGIDTSGIPMLGGGVGSGNGTSGLIVSGTPRGGGGSSGSGDSGGSSSKRSGESASASRTVAITINGGRATSVGATDDASADALEAVLKRLAEAANRS